MSEKVTSPACFAGNCTCQPACAPQIERVNASLEAERMRRRIAVAPPAPAQLDPKTFKTPFACLQCRRVFDHAKVCCLNRTVEVEKKDMTLDEFGRATRVTPVTPAGYYKEPRA